MMVLWPQRWAHITSVKPDSLKWYDQKYNFISAIASAFQIPELYNKIFPVVYCKIPAFVFCFLIESESPFCMLRNFSERDGVSRGVKTDSRGGEKTEGYNSTQPPQARGMSKYGTWLQHYISSGKGN